MKDQVSIIREKGVKDVVLGAKTSERENKEASIWSEGNTTSCLRGLFISPNDQRATQAVK